MSMFVLACSVGVCCMWHISLFSVRCITKVLMRWVVLAAAHCEGTLRSPGLASCAVAAGSIHHNLTFNWRGARQERERRQQRGREKKRQRYRNRERRERSVSTPGWWIYWGMISLFWEVDDGWDVAGHNVSAEKFPFTGGSARAGWQMMWSAEPLHLTSHRQASMMGISLGVCKVGKRNSLWNSLAVSQGRPSHTASMLLSRGEAHLCTFDLSSNLSLLHFSFYFLNTHIFHSRRMPEEIGFALICPHVAQNKVSGHSSSLTRRSRRGKEPFFASRTGRSGQAFWTSHHIIRT